MSKYFIEDPIRPKPKQVTIEDIKEVTRDQRLDWEEWEIGDAKSMLLLLWNVTQAPAQVMQLSDTAKECWEQLQITYGDTERILAHDASVELIEINRENFTSVEAFTIGFRSAVTRLDALSETLLPIRVVCFFIFAAEKGYPIRAERQHSFLRRQKEAPKIDDLITDLLFTQRHSN